MNTISLRDLFRVFFKIGAFTIGGGYAMIPVVQHEIQKRGWIPEDEFPDIIAIAQSAPGLLAVNMAIFTGYRLRGTKGSIVATLGSIIPSFIIILLVAIVFTSLRDYPIVERIFQGVRPMVVGLILVPMVNMMKKSNHHWWAWVLSFITMIAVAFLHFSPLYIIIVILVVAYALVSYKESKK